MSEQPKNQIIVLEPCTKTMQELLKALEEKGQVDILRANSPEEALQEISGALPCILLASIPANEAVPSRVNLFKRLESSVRGFGLKICVVTPVKNRQLAELATQKLNVSEFIIEPVHVRTLQFKVNLLLKSVDNFRRQQQLKKLADEKIVIKKLENSNGKNTVEDSTALGVKSAPKLALKETDDIFLFKSSPVKKTGKRFTFEIEGPAPETGAWVPHEDKGNAKTSWRWVPREEKEKESADEGPDDGWVAEGDEPVFDQTSKKWMIKSEKPSLSYRSNGKKIAEKITTTETGEVVVAEDSTAAEENLKKNREKAAALRATESAPRFNPIRKENAKEEEEKEKGPLGLKSLKPNDDQKKTNKEKKSGSSEEGKAIPLNDLTLEGEEGKTSLAGELNDKRSAEAGKKPLAFRNRQAEGEEEKKESAFRNRTGEKGEEDQAEGLKDLRVKEKSESTNTSPKSSKNPWKTETTPKGVNPLKEDEFSEKGIQKRSSLKQAEPEDKNSPLQLRQPGKEEAKKPAPETNSRSPKEALEERRKEKKRLAVEAEPDEKEREAAAQLRGDPAEKRADLRDLRDRKKQNLLSSLRDERKKLVEKIRSTLETPLGDQLDAIEEDKLRGEFDLRGKPEIKPKELLRKKRLKTVKELKEKLTKLDLDLSSENEDHQGEIHSAKEEKQEDEKLERLNDLTAPKLKGIGRAIQGEEAESEKKEKARKKIKVEEEVEKKKLDFTDKYNYMPAADLQPIGNAWDSTGDTYYVYLHSNARYRGFGKLEELLPLWIFKGDEIPALLDRTNQWRFLGGLPTLARTITEVPSEVREFLLNIRETVRSNTPEEAAEEKKPAKKWKKKNPEDESDEQEKDSDKEKEDSDLNDPNEVDAEEKSKSPENVEAPKIERAGKNKKKPEDTSEDIFERKKDKTKNSAGDAQQQEEDSEEDPEEELPDEEEKEDEDESDSADKRSDDTDRDALRDRKTSRKIAKSSEEKPDPKRGRAKTEDSTGSDDLYAPGNKKDKSKNEDASVDLSDKKSQDGKIKADEAEILSESKNDSEKEKPKDAGEESMEEPVDKKIKKEIPATANDDLKNKEPQEQLAELKQASDKNAKDTLPEKLADTKSDGIKKFLEKRKNQKGRQSETKKQDEKDKRAQETQHPPPGYLSIYVTLSDGYGLLWEPQKSISKVLGSIESTFGDCTVFCLAPEESSDKARVWVSSPSDQAQEQNIDLGSGIKMPIQSVIGSKSELLGYLYLRFTGTRQKLEVAEEEAFRQIAIKLWPLVSNMKKKTDKQAA